MLRWVPRWIRRLFWFVLIGLVIWYVVLPQFGRAESAFDTITGVNVGFIVLGGALVAAAIAAQAGLTRRTLPRSERPTAVQMIRIELATMAVSHTLPGGTAAGTALAYRLLTEAGVRGPSAGFALGVRGIGSALVLNVILWAALVVSVPRQGFDPRYTMAAALGAALLGFVGLVVVGLLRARDATVRRLCRLARPVPFVDADAVPEVVDRLADQLKDLIGDRRLAVRATSYAAAYWLGLAAALWVLLHAFGWTGDPISVLVAFGIVNVLAAVPVTPRGLGVVEAVLVPMLVGFGAPVQIVTLAVVSWRLLSFWIPIPLGSLAYVSLRVARPDVNSPERREISGELAAVGASAGETMSAWARRHCLRRPCRTRRRDG